MSTEDETQRKLQMLHAAFEKEKTRNDLPQEERILRCVFLLAEMDRLQREFAPISSLAGAG